MAGEGRFFIAGDAKARVLATIENCVDSVLCTVLRNDGAEVRTVEHLLSSLEALGVDNCQIEIHGGNEVRLISVCLSSPLCPRSEFISVYFMNLPICLCRTHTGIVKVGSLRILVSSYSQLKPYMCFYHPIILLDGWMWLPYILFDSFIKGVFRNLILMYQIPLLDGSSKGWMELIRSTGLCLAMDDKGLEMEKLVPKLLEPVYLRRDDSFIVAFPSSETRITYGIDFPKVSGF